MMKRGDLEPRTDFSVRMAMAWLLDDDPVPGEPMPDEQRPLSFADSRTHFRLPRGGEGKTGGHIDEPTGEVECMACGRSAQNVDEIPHQPDCPQRYVHSEYYLDHATRTPRQS